MSDEFLDVRRLPYMPLVIETLRKSKTWLRCRRRPELSFYVLNLWMRAWHEVPAGSIEDDDDVLADAAMCAPEAWTGLKEILLEGWERRDGRVYHRTVTELATEAATKLRGNKKRTEEARKAAEERRRATATTDVTEPVTETVTELATEAATENVTEPVTEHEGKGREGKVIRKVEPTGSTKSRGSRLPADWLLPDEWRSDAIDRGLPTSRIETEAEKFKNHFSSLPAQRGVKLDWRATWRNWVHNAATDFGRQAKQPQTGNWRDDPVYAGVE